MDDTDDDDLELDLAAVLTPAQACAYAKLSRRSLTRLTSQGFLPRVGLATRPRYRREDLDQVIDFLPRIKLAR